MLLLVLVVDVVVNRSWSCANFKPLQLTNFTLVDLLDFFVELAKSKNFDTSDAEKWYSITRKDILQAVISFS
jgi:hypothetical protein